MKILQVTCCAHWEHISWMPRKVVWQAEEACNWSFWQLFSTTYLCMVREVMVSWLNYSLECCLMNRKPGLGTPGEKTDALVLHALPRWNIMLPMFGFRRHATNQVCIFTALDWIHPQHPQVYSTIAAQLLLYLTTHMLASLSYPPLWVVLRARDNCLYTGVNMKVDVDQSPIPPVLRHGITNAFHKDL